MSPIYFIEISKRSLQKIHEREKEMLKLLEWFKVDKSPLIKDIDPNIIQMKEKMKHKARRRLNARRRREESGGKL